MKKALANCLNVVISTEIKSRPHFIRSTIWTQMRGILSEIRDCMVDVVVSKSKIQELESFILIHLNMIVMSASTEEIPVMIDYINDIFEHYIQLGIKYE